MGVHLSIKAKLVVTAEAKQELKSSMEEFNRACNTLSELAFEQNLHRKYDINHEGYRLIREETSLPAQHVINAIAKVSGVYVREPNKLHPGAVRTSDKKRQARNLEPQALSTARLSA
jgi:putative transposase